MMTIMMSKAESIPMYNDFFMVLIDVWHAYRLYI